MPDEVPIICAELETYQDQLSERLWAVAETAATCQLPQRLRAAATEAEIEYATRAGAATARYYGESEELLPHYAWYQGNSQEKFWPVGTRKPNDFGLFDTQGNVFTWCQGSYQLYPEGDLVEDNDDELIINASSPRALRGGSFIDRPPLVRSAFRNAEQPTSRNHSFGFGW